MLRQSFILLLLFFLIAAFSFETSSNVSTSQEVKNFFLEEAEKFKLQTDTLNKAIKKGDEKQIQEQFFKTRYAYKQIEIFAEYFYAFYAVKLNGPAIPFFEEADPDVPVQQPTGMQLIETDIFPHFNKKKKNELQDAAAELVRYAAEMPTINEDFDFDDNNIFDAVMEELFRITALGITGFDSQVANNSLI